MAPSQLRDVKALQALMAEMTAAMPEVQRSAVTRAARLAKQEIDTAAKPYRIRGRRGAKVPLTVRVSMIRRRSGGIESSAAVITATPAGFWGIVQRGSRPHEIVPRDQQRTRRGRRQKARADGTFRSRLGPDIGQVRQRGTKRLAVPGTGRGYFYRVNHPGHGPIGDPWGQGRQAFDAQAEKVLATAAMTGYRRILAGRIAAAASDGEV